MIGELEDAEVGDTVTIGDENPEFEVKAVDDCPGGYGGEAYRELFGDEYSIILGDTGENSLTGGARNPKKWAILYKRRTNRWMYEDSIEEPKDD